MNCTTADRRECPLFSFPELLAAVQAHWPFHPPYCLRLLEEVRIDLERDRRVGMTEAMLHFGKGRARRHHSRGAAMTESVERHASQPSPCKRRVGRNAQ